MGANSAIETTSSNLPVIVIAVNKLDYYLCKICVASIRYYYPDISIYLLKDTLNGAFSTRELEQYWNVEVISFVNHQKFGWSAAKMFFVCDPRFQKGRYLLIDSDIVLIGKIFDNSAFDLNQFDIVVSNEYEDPQGVYFEKNYFNYAQIKAMDPSYEYPGYTFNAGQLFFRGGFIKKETIDPYFDFEKFPFWKRKDLFPLVDQSLYNYLLPKLERQNELSIGKTPYMIWSESERCEKLTMTEILQGQHLALIHWAGAKRVIDIETMTRNDVLQYFQQYYYARIPMGFIKIPLEKIQHKATLFFRKVRKKLSSM